MLGTSSRPAYGKFDQPSTVSLCERTGDSGCRFIVGDQEANYRRRMTAVVPQPGRVSVLLVCSPGGHLQQLATLRHVWDDYSRAWVTLDKSDARSMLEGERIVFARGPTERNLGNLARNLVLAASVIRELRPAVIITTGAALAVPFVWVGRLYRARIVFIESMSRITKPSLALRLSAPALDRIYVQWPELRSAVRDSRFVGSLLSS